jgi:endonuclease/exonuclease/phosphatase family metal-dependent hydrolase
MREMRITNMIRLPVLALLLMPLLLSSPLSAAEPDGVRVMSYNLRYGTANDGENRWERRRDFLVETVAAFDPDLLGTQETLAFQKDYLAEKLDGYTAFGVGRERGDDSGEMTAILYRTARFEKLDGGHFWLSETPEVIGSMGWDTSLPRMASWLKLKDTKAAGGPVLWLFNTHFDHRGEQARRESATLLRRKIAEMTGGERTIVTGDFNAAEGSVPYENLFAAGENGEPLLVDTWRAVHPERQEHEGTFSGFDIERVGTSRIDWIGCTGDWEIVSAGIDRTARDGRTPSDHLPVTAVLRHPQR